MTIINETLGPTYCDQCGDRFEGTRFEARRAGWEPCSTRTQWELDHGPIVCRSCVAEALDAALAALMSVS